MHTVNVLVIQPIVDEELAQIARLDPRLCIIDARGWFDDEIRQTWPQWTVERYLGKRPCPPSTRAERDRLLAQAEVILGGWPFPLDLRARAPRLQWFHQRPAGASNLLRGDLWGSDVSVTTSRGYGNTRSKARPYVSSAPVGSGRRSDACAPGLGCASSARGGTFRPATLCPQDLAVSKVPSMSIGCWGRVTLS